MALNLKEDAFVDATPLKRGTTAQPAAIPKSNNISGIELRLSRALIINNKTPKVGPFPGFSKMYLVIVVVSDIGTVMQTLDLKSFAKVNDNEDLPVDKTIYYWKQNKPKDKAPSQIHTLISIVKSKQALRDTGKILSDVKNDSEYASLVDTLKTTIGNAADLTNISNLVFSAASIVGKYLGQVEDKALFTWVKSFTDINGDWDQLGTTIKTQKNNFASIDLSLTIRDKNREVALAKANGLSIEELENA